MTRFNDGKDNYYDYSLDISTRNAFDTGNGIALAVYDKDSNSYFIDRGSLTSYVFRENMRDAIDDYCKLMRDPATGDNSWSKSWAYNIANVHRIVTDAINKYTFQTWKNNTRNFTLTLQNTSFVKKNLDVVEQYTEAASKAISAYLSARDGFSNTIRMLIGDREELGFAYAFIKKDSTNPFGYSLNYLGYGDVEFIIDDSGAPSEFWIFTHRPIKERDNLKRNKEDQQVIFYLTHVSRKPGSQNKWITRYLCSNNIKHSDHNRKGATYIEIGKETTDYRPVLYTRKNVNSSNPLGFGSGLICLSSIKELHNGIEKKKEILLLITKLIAVYRRDGLNNDQPNVPNIYGPALPAGDDEVKAILAKLEEKESDTELKPLSYFTSYFDRPQLVPSSTLFNNKELDEQIIKIASIDNTLPMSDQFHLVPINVDTTTLNELIQEYLSIIELVFDPNSFFNRGQSRMSVAEVETREELDQMTTNDLTNPIIHDIVSPYIKLIIRKNAKTLLDPNYLENPKSIINRYTDYLAELKDASPDTIFQEVSDIQKDLMIALPMISAQIQDEFGIELSWNGNQANARNNEDVAKFAQSVQIIQSIYALKQFDPNINITPLLESLRTITNVKIASQTVQPQSQPGLPDNVQQSAERNQVLEGSEELQ